MRFIEMKFNDRVCLVSRLTTGVDRVVDALTLSCGMVCGPSARAVRLLQRDTNGILATVADVLDLGRATATMLPTTSTTTSRVLRAYFESIQLTVELIGMRPIVFSPQLPYAAYMPQSVAKIGGVRCLVAVTTCSFENMASMTRQGLVDDVQLGMAMCGCSCAHVLTTNARTQTVVTVRSIEKVTKVDLDPGWCARFTESSNAFGDKYLSWFLHLSDFDGLIGKGIVERLVANNLVNIDQIERIVEQRNGLGARA